MAGRGRGRGRTHLSFSVEAVGISKGENLPPSSVQPTPLFPSLEHKPLPLQTGEEAEYMLALKQELRGAMKTLPFYLRPAAPKKDVERYSDKYQSVEACESRAAWIPDWKRLPKELRVHVKRPSSKKSLAVPKLGQRPQADVEIIQKLETLEKKEKEASSDEEERGDRKAEQEEDEAEGEDVYDEEEFEEETDYIMSYLENEEDLGADSDDNMDEAVY